MIYSLAVPIKSFMQHSFMALSESNYRLLDFGMGRKLESFGNLIVDRPCPGANSAKKDPSLWKQASLSYDSVISSGWHFLIDNELAIDNWFCVCQGIRMTLKPTPAGQVGVFPEHWGHWPWLLERLTPAKKDVSEPRVLSLFAYTGATTLALARAGFAVTHLDSSKPTVAWARENAKHSSMGEASTRWIVEDATSFVKRELRRNSQYEAILLDPPTYGHGAKGTRWEIHRHLLPLLMDCWSLLSENKVCVLLCGHSSHIDLRVMNAALTKQHGPKSVTKCEIVQACLVDSFGRKLDCGFAAKYSF